LQRVGGAAMLLQLVVYDLHEAMEVAALLVLERQALKEQIHQPRLAAADSAPDVEPFLQRPRAPAPEESFQEPAFRCRGEQAFAQLIEARNDLFLRRIGAIAESRALGAIQIDNAGKRGGMGRQADTALDVRGSGAKPMRCMRMLVATFTAYYKF